MKTITIPVYVLYMLLIGILAISTIFVFAMKDGGECLANPLVYGAEKAWTSHNQGILCSCSFGNPSYASFYFNKDGMQVRDQILP